MNRRSVRVKEELEDTKGVIRIRKSKDRQHNGQNQKEQKVLLQPANLTWIDVPAGGAYSCGGGGGGTYPLVCGGAYPFVAGGAYPFTR